MDRLLQFEYWTYPLFGSPHGPFLLLQIFDIFRFSHTKSSSEQSSRQASSRQPSAISRQPAATSQTFTTLQPRIRDGVALPPPIRSVELLPSNFQSLNPVSGLSRDFLSSNGTGPSPGSGFNRVHTVSISSDTSWAEAPEFVPRYAEGNNSSLTI